MEELGKDYAVALAVVGGNTPPTQPSAATLQVIKDLCSALDRDDRTGCMVVIRTPIEGGIKAARMLTRQLRTARRAAGLDGTFAVIVDVDARVTDSFNATIDHDMPGARSAMAKWRHGPEAQSPLRVKLYTDLADLPCILILCERGKMGDTFPASFRYYDLRLRYTRRCGSRSALEQDLGRACRYRPSTEYGRKRYPLPTIMVSREANTVVRLEDGVSPGANNDPMVRLLPDARMWRPRGRRDALGENPTDEQLSAHYRGIWWPKFRRPGRRKDERHFDSRAHDVYAGTEEAPEPGSKPWVNNSNHFLLQGLPQIGKTGAFLAHG